MILVTGANGMVGSYVGEVFKGEPLFLTSRESMDIRDYKSVQKIFESVQPKIVLHLAAATDLDRCEKEPTWAHQTNILGTQNIVLACQAKNALLVYVSTSGLFDGQKMDSYTEFDTPNPINIYAKTKWEAEKIVQNLLHQYFIVRAGWMIGGNEKDKKFVSKMIALCQQESEISVVSDKMGTITYAKDLLETIRNLLATPFYGLYHVANEGVCSRYDVALEVAKCLHSSVKINPVTSAFFPQPAPRPRSEAICNWKLKLMGWVPLRGWQEALNCYLKEYSIS